MKALLKFNNDEDREFTEGNDEATEVHGILLDRIRTLSSLKANDKNLQNEIILSRAIAEMSEQLLKHDMGIVALARAANNMADVNLPKFLLE
jgi:hypothetical protein